MDETGENREKQERKEVIRINQEKTEQTVLIIRTLVTVPRI